MITPTPSIDQYCPNNYIANVLLQLRKVYLQKMYLIHHTAGTGTSKKQNFCIT